MGYETFQRNCLCIFDINVLNFVILNIQSLFSYLVFRSLFIDAIDLARSVPVSIVQKVDDKW